MKLEGCCFVVLYLSIVLRNKKIVEYRNRKIITFVTQPVSEELCTPNYLSLETVFEIGIEGEIGAFENIYTK